MDDDAYFKAVANELAQAPPRTDLWTKALAKSDGNEQVARALYFEMRLQQLTEEHARGVQQANEERQAEAEAQMERHTQFGRAMLVFTGCALAVIIAIIVRFVGR